MLDDHWCERSGHGVGRGRQNWCKNYVTSSAMATLSVTGERPLCGEISATSCASAEISRFWAPPLEFQIEQEVPAHHDIDVPSSGLRSGKTVQSSGSGSHSSRRQFSVGGDVLLTRREPMSR